MASHKAALEACLLLVTAAVLHAAAAPPGTVVDLLPTGTALPSMPDAADEPAAAAAAAAFPSVSAIPTAFAGPRLGGGAGAAAAAPGRPAAGCAAAFAVGQQCGGNMTNAAANCSAFDSCSNVPWSGACCAAGLPCGRVEPSGGTCWSCGGKPPASLATASSAATDVLPRMCTRLAAGGDFDYACVLGASTLFYDAQRSGKLPAAVKARVPWRGDSGLRDVALNGASIAGGWYDAGDLTRFTFPAAFTTSVLALALMEFPDAFDAAAKASLLDSLRWEADWLQAARYQPDAFVAVTWMPGRSVQDAHLFWGAPEDVRGAASVRSLVAPQRGADLLAQGAAALAAVAALTRESDPGYAQGLLDTAQGLYDQAVDPASDGLYSNSIPEVRGYYTSYSYIDDRAWAAAWLALATGDAELLRQARFYYDQHMAVEGGGEMRRFDYNNMVQAVGYLLAKQDPSRKAEYSQPIRTVMDLWLNAQSNITYTPKGMAYIDSWGNLRYVANQGFMGLLHNKLYPGDSARVTAYTCFARKQARIMLGETGRSYVVGVGDNPPCRPHHRGASCPAATDGAPVCDCTALFNPGCNPNTIYGALVGGPGKDEEFEDVRWNFQQSEVALDWNAGFTGLMAGLASADGGGRVSWDQCKAAGQEDGRGSVPPTLSAGGGGRRQLAAAGAALRLLAAATAWLLVAGWLH